MAFNPLEWMKLLGKKTSTPVPTSLPRAEPVSPQQYVDQRQQAAVTEPNIGDRVYAWWDEETGRPGFTFSPTHLPLYFDPVKRDVTIDKTSVPLVYGMSGLESVDSVRPDDWRRIEGVTSGTKVAVKAYQNYMARQPKSSRVPRSVSAPLPPPTNPEEQKRNEAYIRLLAKKRQALDAELDQIMSQWTAGPQPGGPGGPNPARRRAIIQELESIDRRVQLAAYGSYDVEGLTTDQVISNISNATVNTQRVRRLQEVESEIKAELSSGPVSPARVNELLTEQEQLLAEIGKGPVRVLVTGPTGEPTPVTWQYGGDLGSYLPGGRPSTFLKDFERLANITVRYPHAIWETERERDYGELDLGASIVSLAWRAAGEGAGILWRGLTWPLTFVMQGAHLRIDPNTDRDTAIDELTAFGWDRDDSEAIVDDLLKKESGIENIRPWVYLTTHGAAKDANEAIQHVNESWRVYKENIEAAKAGPPEPMAKGAGAGAYAARSAEHNLPLVGAEDNALERLELSRRSIQEGRLLATDEQLTKWSEDAIDASRDWIDARVARTDIPSFSFRYTWPMDPKGDELEEQFKNAWAQSMAQLGRPLEAWEVEELSNHFVNPAYEFAGDLVFDPLNLIPGQVFEAILFKPVKGLVGLGKEAVGLTRPGKWLIRVLEAEALSSAAGRMGHKFNEVWRAALRSSDGNVSEAGKAIEMALRFVKERVQPATAEVLAAKLDRLLEMGINEYHIEFIDGVVRAMMESSANITPRDLDEAIAALTRLLDEDVTHADDVLRTVPGKVQSLILENKKAWQGAPILDEGPMGTVSRLLGAGVKDEARKFLEPSRTWWVKTISQIQNKIWSTHVKLLLTARPGFTVWNYFDSMIRAIIHGANPFDDVERIWNKHSSFQGFLEQLIDSWASSEGLLDVDLTRQIISGQVPTRAGMASVFKLGWERAAGKNVFEKWTSGWGAINSVLEAGWRARLYEHHFNIQWNRAFGLIMNRAEDVLQSHGVIDPEVRRLILSGMYEHQYQGPKLRQLVGEVMTGRVTGPSILIDDAITQGLEALVGPDITRSAMNDVAQGLRAMQQAGELNPKNVNAYFDELIRRADERAANIQETAASLDQSMGGLDEAAKLSDPPMAPTAEQMLEQAEGPAAEAAAVADETVFTVVSENEKAARAIGLKPVYNAPMPGEVGISGWGTDSFGEALTRAGGDARKVSVTYVTEEQYQAGRAAAIADDTARGNEVVEEAYQYTKFEEGQVRWHPVGESEPGAGLPVSETPRTAVEGAVPDTPPSESLPAAEEAAIVRDEVDFDVDQFRLSYAGAGPGGGPSAAEISRVRALSEETARTWASKRRLWTEVRGSLEAKILEMKVAGAEVPLEMETARVYVDQVVDALDQFRRGPYRDFLMYGPKGPRNPANVGTGVKATKYWDEWFVLKGRTFDTLSRKYVDNLIRLTESGDYAELSRRLMENEFPTLRQLWEDIGFQFEVADDGRVISMSYPEGVERVKIVWTDANQGRRNIPAFLHANGSGSPADWNMAFMDEPLISSNEMRRAIRNLQGGGDAAAVSGIVSPPPPVTPKIRVFYGGVNDVVQETSFAEFVAKSRRDNRRIVGLYDKETGEMLFGNDVHGILYDSPELRALWFDPNSSQAKELQLMSYMDHNKRFVQIDSYPPGMLDPDDVEYAMFEAELGKALGIPPDPDRPPRWNIFGKSGPEGAYLREDDDTLRSLSKKLLDHGLDPNTPISVDGLDDAGAYTTRTTLGELYESLTKEVPGQAVEQTAEQAAALPTEAQQAAEVAHEAASVKFAESVQLETQWEDLKPHVKQWATQQAPGQPMRARQMVYQMEQEFFNPGGTTSTEAAGWLEQAKNFAADKKAAEAVAAAKAGTAADPEIQTAWQAVVANPELRLNYKAAKDGTFQDFEAWAEGKIRTLRASTVPADQAKMKTLQLQLLQARQAYRRTLLERGLLDVVDMPFPNLGMIDEGTRTFFNASADVNVAQEALTQAYDDIRRSVLGMLEEGGATVRQYDPATAESALKAADEISSLLQQGLEVVQQGSEHFAGFSGWDEKGRFLGKVFDGALPITNKVMIDYSTQTKLLKGMRTFFPFLRFQWRSVPMWIETMMIHPEITAFYFKYMQTSRRYAYMRGAVDMQGNQRRSLVGYVPLPGTDMWVNPLAPISLRYVFPTTDWAQDEIGAETSIIEDVFNYVVQTGQFMGVGVHPWLATILYGMNWLNPYKTYRYGILPQTKLLPPSWMRSLSSALRTRKFGKDAGDVANFVANTLDPELHFRDYLIERQVLVNALQAMGEMGDLEEKRRLAALVGQSLQYSVRSESPEALDLWTTARDQLESKEWQGNLLGYFTGIYAKPYTTGDAELERLRRELNVLRESLNSEIQVEMFGLDMDPERRWQYYLDERYNSPEGYLYNLRTIIGYVVAEEEIDGEVRRTQLFGEDRLKMLQNRIQADMKIDATYEAAANARETLYKGLKSLPVGASGKLKATYYDEYASTMATSVFDEEAQMLLLRTNNYIGYKPTAVVYNQIREMWFEALRNIAPDWNVDDGQTYDEWQAEYNTWLEDLPVTAQHLMRGFDDMISKKEWADTDVKPDNFWGLLLAETTKDGYDSYVKENDSIYQAIDFVHGKYYLDGYWKAVEGKDGTEKRHLAEMDFYKQWENDGTPTVEQYIEWIGKEYGDRFAPEEIKLALDGRDINTPEERLAETAGPLRPLLNKAFDTLSLIAPGQEYGKFMDAYRSVGGDEGDLDVIYNPLTSQMTKEIELPSSASREWLEDVVTKIERAAKIMGLDDLTRPELEERAQARDLNTKFKEAVTRALGDDIYELQAYYFGLSSSERTEFRRNRASDYARIEKYREMRDQYGEQFPLWANYYIDPEAASTTSGGGGGGGGAGGGGGTGGGGGSAKRASPPGGFAPFGQRSTIDPRFLGTHQIGRTAPSRQPVWPKWLLDRIGPVMAEEVAKLVDSGTVLPPQVEDYLTNLAAKNEDAEPIITPTLGLNERAKKYWPGQFEPEGLGLPPKK